MGHLVMASALTSASRKDRHASIVTQGGSRLSAKDQLFTIEECAWECRRHPRTIKNLISRYQLPHKTAVVIRRRHRQYVTSLRLNVVLWLRAITFEGDRKALKRLPR
jgi:hypothetical protein